MSIVGKRPMGLTSKNEDIKTDNAADIESDEKKSNEFDTSSIRDRGSGMYVKSSVASVSFIDESHPECKFCKKQFDEISESQRENFKKNLVKKAKTSAPVENKEEEFFKMCLLSF